MTRTPGGSCRSYAQPRPPDPPRPPASSYSLVLLHLQSCLQAYSWGLKKKIKTVKYGVERQVLCKSRLILLPKTETPSPWRLQKEGFIADFISQASKNESSLKSVSS